MKIVEKISLIIFSNIILILSVILCLVMFGWLDEEILSSMLEIAKNNPTTSNIIVIVSAVFILLAIKCIFFDSSSKEVAKQKEGILLQNNDGKLLISKDTLENLIASVAQGFEGAENVASKVFVDSENNLSIYVTLFVHEDAVIKDLSANLQAKIKEAVKKSSDLDVKEVNIQVRNIAPNKTNIDD